ncbi:MAG: zf-TFIIB domain-containing protein [Gammaproteobacteria bacterium]|nr:zf-TFIIB domain-containing protein [Gammaproteobacteria bacterium]
MLCPKCKNDMELVEYEGVEVDRCKNCKGIWFDVGESDWLLGKDAAEAIDTGDPLIGRQTNEIDTYRCPRCGGGMMRRIDPKRTQIRYEECTSCRGSFFDAGEFSDLIKDSIAELRKRQSAQKE